MNAHDNTKNRIFTWWKVMSDGRKGETRADHAALRRADSVTAALAVRATHKLYHQLQLTMDLQYRSDTLAALVMILVHIKDNSKETLPMLMGEVDHAGGAAKVSSSRFESIIRSDDPLELAMRLRRLLPMVDSRANVHRLAADILFWKEERTRIQWCYDYYGATFPPKITDNQESYKETRNA